MQKFEIIKDFVKKELEWVCSAHDFFHIGKVFKNALKIQNLEQSWNIEIIWASALLHEMLDEKFYTDIEKQELKLKEFLISIIEKEKVEKIIYIIKNIWFWKNLWSEKKEETIEFQIVQDADRLEAIWAIWIARVFAYGWKYKRSIYDPSIPYRKEITTENYRTEKTTSINHFYEKLLKLKDLLNTSWAKKLAQRKHKFMQDFLDEFLAEWNWDI